MIAQGVEAGGHVRGTVPAMELLARIREAVPTAYPVLLAGTVADSGDVRTRLDAGAAAVVCGTRFLMTEESGAHPAYKARLLEANDDGPHRALRRRLARSAPRRGQPGNGPLAR